MLVKGAPDDTEYTEDMDKLWVSILRILWNMW